MSDVKGISTLYPPPTVIPNDAVTLHFPVHGTDEDLFTINIRNPTMNRLTFKIRCTKENLINIIPMYGFIEPKNDKVVEFAPEPMMTVQGWNKFDSITVLVACAPKGNLWVAQEIWEPTPPKDIITHVIKMQTAGGAISSSKPVAKIPAKKVGPVPITKATSAFKVATAAGHMSFASKSLAVDPSVLTIRVPCAGTPDENKHLIINNPKGERLVWTIKGSKIHLFAVEPRCGFLEPYSQATVEVQPKRMPDPKAFSADDQFTIMFSKAPDSNMYTAKDIWAGNAAFKVTQSETLTVKIKAMTDAELKLARL